MKFQVSPFVIVIDTAEQAPWHFQGLTADKSQGGKPIIVEIERKKLKTGDYSMVGFEDQISIERKSKSDLFGTLSPKTNSGQRRRLFELELDRMSEMEYSEVLVEASWESCMIDPPDHSKFSPKSMNRSIIAWRQRFGVHFTFMPTVDMAMRHCFITLERFYRDTIESKR